MTRRQFYLHPVALTLCASVLILLGGARLSFTAVIILLRQSAILGILCIGLGLVVLVGGIDLSVGAILSLGSGICLSIWRKLQGSKPAPTTRASPCFAISCRFEPCSVLFVQT